MEIGMGSLTLDVSLMVTILVAIALGNIINFFVHGILYRGGKAKQAPSNEVKGDNGNLNEN